MFNDVDEAGKEKKKGWTHFLCPNENKTPPFTATGKIATALAHACRFLQAKKK